MRGSRLGRVVAAAVLVAAPLTAAPGVAAGATTLCVEVVVDYGALADRGAPARPSAYCAKVPDGSTGADVLAVRARELGKPPPRYNDGLLCAIDGLPETGCGEENADGTFSYWSYWHKRGDGAWAYSSRGAFGYTMRDDPDTPEVERFGEGWAWVQGQPEGGRAPANIPYAEVCPTDPPKSSSPAPRPAATRAAGAAKPRPAASTAPARTGSSEQPAAVVAPAATASRAAGVTASPAGSSSAAPSATPSAALLTPSNAPVASAPAYDVETRAEGTRAVADDDGPPVGLLIGLLIAAALATGAVVQARRRAP